MTPYPLCLACLLTVAADGMGQDSLSVFPDSVVLAGMHEGRQLLVTLARPGDRGNDLTRKVTYTVTVPGVASISPSGFVRPVGKGETTITVEALGQKCTVKVIVG